MEASPFDEDDPRAASLSPRREPLEPPSPPPSDASAGIRVGTIDRAVLVTVLDRGPGEFLRQLEVTSAMDGDQFIGWRLVQLLDPRSSLSTLDLAAGDILLALNGAPLSRPEQLMTVWESLRSANSLTCDLLRGQTRFQLSFTIHPAIDSY